MKLPKQNVQFLNKQELEKKWKELQQSLCIGYIWMSDTSLKKEHCFLEETPLPSWEDLHTKNNFIYEAHLYQKDKKSIAIKQCNESWIFTEIEWEQAPEKYQESCQDSWATHEYRCVAPMSQYKCRFVEAWLAQEDEFCEGMEVLQPAWRAFIGFIPLQGE